MKPQCRVLLESAERKLSAARLLLREGLPGDAASRAYYAAFHAISALHLSRGQSFSSHSQVIGHFNKAFVKAGVFSPELTRILTRLFEDRQTGDYDVAVSLSLDRAEQDIEDAVRVVTEVSVYLTKSAPDSGP